jgi:hypothetical protein
MSGCQSQALIANVGDRDDLRECHTGERTAQSDVTSISVPNGSSRIGAAPLKVVNAALCSLPEHGLARSFGLMA